MGKWNAGDNGQLERHNPGILFVEPRAQPEGKILKESSRSMEEAQDECRFSKNQHRTRSWESCHGDGGGKRVGIWGPGGLG